MFELKGIRGQIEIEVVDVQVEPVPDYGTMRWRVVVSSHGLSGQYDEIHIMPANYERFLRELAVLERNRQGTASLTSASPEELQITFRSMDRLGHMLLEGQLGRYTYVGSQTFIQKLIFAFEFDASILSEILSVFSSFQRPK